METYVEFVKAAQWNKEGDLPELVTSKVMKIYFFHDNHTLTFLSGDTKDEVLSKVLALLKEDKYGTLIAFYESSGRAPIRLSEPFPLSAETVETWLDNVMARRKYSFLTSNPMINVNPGDWVVEHSQGIFKVMRDKHFVSRYKEAHEFS